MISYKLFLWENSQLSDLPFWVNFDPNEKIAYFDATNITLDGKSYVFALQGMDNFTESAKTNFNVEFWSSKPVLNKRLQPQYDATAKNARVGSSFQFELESDTFTDTEKLIY